jgi:hypothetical protein
MNLLVSTTQIDPTRYSKGMELPVFIEYFNKNEQIVRAKVQSSDKKTFYDVSLLFKHEKVSCTCKDFEHQTAPCKHIAAVNAIGWYLLQGLKPTQIKRG